MGTHVQMPYFLPCHTLQLSGYCGLRNETRSKREGVNAFLGGGGGICFAQHLLLHSKLKMLFLLFFNVEVS